MGGFVNIVGRIVEHIPFALTMVERFLGPSNGAAKKVAAANEILEFVNELIKQNPADEWSDVEPLDHAALIAALEDEEEFVEHITNVNDSVVALVNYVNSKRPDAA
jgi:hypothetical protein